MHRMYVNVQSVRTSHSRPRRAVYKNACGLKSNVGTLFCFKAFCIIRFRQLRYDCKIYRKVRRPSQDRKSKTKNKSSEAPSKIEDRRPRKKKSRRAPSKNEDSKNSIIKESGLLKVAGTSLVTGFKAAGGRNLQPGGRFSCKLEVVKSGRG